MRSRSNFRGQTRGQSWGQDLALTPEWEGVVEGFSIGRCELLLTLAQKGLTADGQDVVVDPWGYTVF